MPDAPSSFTPAEHTLVMKAIYDRPLNVVHHLETPKGVAPTAEQALDAALAVRAFSPEVKDVLARLREQLPAIEARRAQASPETVAAAEAMIEQIMDTGFAEGLTMLAQAREQHPELADNLAWVEEMYRDGADTIYSPDYAPAEYLQGVTLSDRTCEAMGIVAANATTALIGVTLADGLGAVIAGPGGALLASTTGAVTAIVIEAAT